MGKAFVLKVESNGVANLIFDLKDDKINKLSMEVMQELDEVLDKLASRDDIKALTITSAKPNIFIAGADIKSFEGAFKDQKLAEELVSFGHKVFDKLAALPFPTIAVIDGACLGGGCELALACDFRVVTDNPKTKIGLPEVSLGIFPGWGGSQRVPRLIGLEQGLNLILSGRPIDGKKASKIGLADAYVASAFVDQKLEEFVQQVLDPKEKKKILAKRNKGGLRKILLEGNPLGRALMYNLSKKQILKKTKGQYPSPLIALDLIKRTFTMPLQKGLKEEIRTFVHNLKGEPFKIARNIIHVYFTHEDLKKNPGIPNGTKPEPVRSAGVLGAGTMGAGITWMFSYKDIPVRMKDIKWEFVSKGLDSINKIYKTLVRIRRLKPNQVPIKMQHVGGTVDYAGFQNVDLVVEAAVEDIKLKHTILNELEKVVKKDAVIGSNTSSLTIKEIGKDMEHPERLVGIHFFNPANRMPLVEVVPGEKSTHQAVANAVGACQQLGKTPIVVGDCSGFLVNRIFIPAANEIMHLLQEGAPMKKIEKAMFKFGLPMSPFELCDEVGNDVNHHVVKSLEKAYGERMEGPEIVNQVYEKKLFGKKVGKGFYVYNGKKKEPNPEIEQLLAGKSKPSVNVTEDEMIMRVVSTMVNEAARCIDEKIINDPAKLDMALIMGIGFPPFRGGLLWYADEIGIDKIVEHLKSRTEKRYEPAPLLVKMAKEKKMFFQH